MRRFLPIILAIVIAFPVSASTKDHISDYAGLLSEEEVNELNSEIMEMEYHSDCKFYIVTTYDDDGLGAKGYAEGVIRGHRHGAGPRRTSEEA